MAAPVLYSHPFSSYCQKVLIAFYEAGAPFETRALDNPQAAEELKQLWSVERFPILKTDDGVLLESSIIIEWLDRRTGAGLIPSNPDEALHVRMLDRVFDSYVMTPMQAIVFERARPPEANRDPHGVAKAREILDKAYGWLEERMGSAWAAGDGFTLADCAAAPALFYANWVQPFDAFPGLVAYYRRLRARPSFARVVDEAWPFRPFFPGGVPEGRD